MGQLRKTGWFGRLAFTLLFVSTARAAFAEDLGWKQSLSFDYESGTYGTSVRSSSLYVPATLRRDLGDWHASLTLPYLSQTSDGQVRNIGGRAGRVSRGAGPASAVTRSGLGDIVARGGYALLRDDARSCDLSVVGKLKAPTADKDKGLGTGEFDAGLGLEFGKLVVPGWTALADVEFTKMGDPPGTDLNDLVALDVGFSHLLRTDLALTVLLAGSNALVSGEPGSGALRAGLDYSLDGRWSVHGGGLIGLTNGSPDHGLSFGGAYRF